MTKSCPLAALAAAVWLTAQPAWAAEPPAVTEPAVVVEPAVVPALPTKPIQRVILTPGGASNWLQTHPTRNLTSDQAHVLTDGLSYLSAGTSGLAFRSLGLGGAGMQFSRGMGYSAELSAGLAAAYTLNAPFNARLSLGWKQQVIKAATMAVAVNGELLAGVGGATSVGLLLGAPVSFDVGEGHVTAHPRAILPNSLAGLTAAQGELGLNYINPLISNWLLLVDLVPTYTLSGVFTLPAGVGARYSPTSQSHVDFTISTLTITPTFTATVGLVGVTGHVGF